MLGVNIWGDPWKLTSFQPWKIITEKLFNYLFQESIYPNVAEYIRAKVQYSLHGDAVITQLTKVFFLILEFIINNLKKKQQIQVWFNY